MKKTWTESEAITWIRDCNVMISNKNIYILNSTNGLTTLSAADYLKNHKGYRLLEVGKR